MDTEAPTIPVAVSKLRQSIVRLDEIAFFLRDHPELGQLFGMSSDGNWRIHCDEMHEFIDAAAALAGDDPLDLDTRHGYVTVSRLFPCGGRIFVQREQTEAEKAAAPTVPFVRDEEPF